MIIDVKCSKMIRLSYLELIINDGLQFLPESLAVEDEGYPLVPLHLSHVKLDVCRSLHVPYGLWVFDVVDGTRLFGDFALVWRARVDLVLIW